MDFNPRLERSGFTIAGHQFGEGTTVLCLHGWLDNCFSFAKLGENIRGFDCYALIYLATASLVIFHLTPFRLSGLCLCLEGVIICAKVGSTSPSSWSLYRGRDCSYFLQQVFLSW